MKGRTLLLLIAAAVLAIGIAVFMQSTRKPQTEVRDQAQPMLPALHDHVNDVNTVTLTGAESKPIATLKRGPDGWTIAERSGYPADLSRIRAFLLKLDNAKLVEPKTSNPQRHADIGVEDVKNAGAKGVLVELGGLTPPQKLIIGLHTEQSGGTFVRRDGENQSWLASGNLTPATNAGEWAVRDLTGIPLARWQSVTLTAPDGKVFKLHKENAEDADFRSADVPKGRELDGVAANGVANMLAALRADNVFASKDVAPGDKIYKADFVAFDGLVVNAKGWTRDEKHYAQFAASLDSALANAKIAADQAAAKADADKADAIKAAEPAAGKAPTEPAAPKSSSDAAAANKGAGAEPPKNAQGADAGAKPLAVTDPAKDRQEKLDALNKEVEALNKAFTGWTFVLPAYHYSNMAKTTDALLKRVDTGPPAKGAPGAAPQPGLPPGMGLPPGALPQGAGPPGAPGMAAPPMTAPAPAMPATAPPAPAPATKAPAKAAGK